MINPHSISTISDLRFKTKEVFKKANKEPVFLFNRSTPKGVLLSLEKYQQLLGDLEDEGLPKDKSKVKWVPFSEIEKLAND